MGLPVIAPVGAVPALGQAYTVLQGILEAEAVKDAAAFFSEEISKFSVTFLGFDASKDLSDYTTEELVNGLKLTTSATPMSAGSVDGRDYLFDVARRGLAAVDLLKSRWETEGHNNASPELDASLAAANQTEGEIFKKTGVAAMLNKDSLSPAARKKLNKFTRKRIDGQRVSKEEHEYRYCLNSGQIQEVFTAANIPPPSNPRYGPFVESKLMRKAIELLRKLRRVTHAKNAKDLTELMGTDPGQLYLLLRDSPENMATWTGAANEFLSFSP